MEGYLKNGRVALEVYYCVNGRIYQIKTDTRTASSPNDKLWQDLLPFALGGETVGIGQQDYSKTRDKTVPHKNPVEGTIRSLEYRVNDSS